MVARCAWQQAVARGLGVLGVEVDETDRTKLLGFADRALLQQYQAYAAVQAVGARMRGTLPERRRKNTFRVRQVHVKLAGAVPETAVDGGATKSAVASVQLCSVVQQVTLHVHEGTGVGASRRQQQEWLLYRVVPLRGPLFDMLVDNEHVGGLARFSPFPDAAVALCLSEFDARPTQPPQPPAGVATAGPAAAAAAAAAAATGSSAGAASATASSPQVSETKNVNENSVVHVCLPLRAIKTGLPVQVGQLSVCSARSARSPCWAGRPV